MIRLAFHIMIISVVLIVATELRAEEVSSAKRAGALHRTAFAGDTQRNAIGPDTFAVVASIAGGYAHYMNPHGSGVELNRSGAAFSLRLLWYPDHRLRLGLESGWTTLYSYDLYDIETTFGKTDASLNLSAVPLLVVFSMQVIGPVSLSAGVGGYIVRSHAKSFGVTVDVTRFSQGWMGAITWPEALSFGPQIGVELKWYGATEFGDSVLTLQLQAKMSFFR